MEDSNAMSPPKHYSETRPKEFSSENFKIEINTKKNMQLNQMRKFLLVKNSLKCVKVKPCGRKAFFCNFKSQEDLDQAKDILSSCKDLIERVKMAKPRKDPMFLARQEGKPPEEPNLPLETRVLTAVAPLHAVPYCEQLKTKFNEAKDFLAKLSKELGKINPALRRNAQTIPLDDIIASPVQEGYRNKCEFTVGRSAAGAPVVGFRVSAYKGGSLEVGPIDNLRHINEKMKQVVRLMEKFLDGSQYPPFDPYSHEGVWRALVVRTSTLGDTMIVVHLHPQDLPEDTLKLIKQDLVSFYVEGEGKEAGLTSLYVQVFGQISSGDKVPFELLYGESSLKEIIRGKTFLAGPDSFLQVNSAACEKLYEKVEELAGLDGEAVALDLCCGVGTIGISVADRAFKVYGVELTESAVENARVNAEKNAARNVHFYHGKTEDYLPLLLNKDKDRKVVAIVDPPRPGLQGSVMAALRRSSGVERIVYVACCAPAAMHNFVALCKPASKTYRGDFFVPVRAAVVDLFPDTPHFELVIVFERFVEGK